MELSLREWLIILGVLVIIAVLIDGYRRVRSNRRNSLKLAIDKNLKFSDDDRVDYFHGELPGGGSRVVQRHEDDDAEAYEDDYGEELDSEPEHEDPDHQDAGHENESMPESLFVDEEADARVEDSAELSAADEPEAEAPAATTVEEAPKPPAAVEEVIVINLMARTESGFNGAELMHVILACGMRFGDMDIFHRNEKDDGSGAVQFSMANLVKPGTFDLDSMDDFFTPGVSFFLSLPGPTDFMQAFDFMLETAQCVAKNLDGEMKDENRSVMTAQTIEHARQRIRDYERRQLSLLS